jgi:3-oxoacyl-[acyl-carrier-protein] synthase-1
VRAGITVVAEHPFLIDRAGVPIPAARDDQLDPNLLGPRRMLVLAESALREACLALDNAPPPGQRLPVYLGLPSPRPGFSQPEAELIRTGLARLEGLPVELAEITVFAQGHSAGLAALAAAAETLQTGANHACLVGGVDSYFQPETLGWLEDHRQIAGGDSRSGFIPGEGACFVLLVSEPARARWSLGALASVIAVASGLETKLIKTSDTCLGEGLITAVQDAVSSVITPTERINDILCDINGERYRSEEWGFVCLRLSQFFDDPTAYQSPADCWGDMGAASGPLLTMLACRAFARGYSKGPRTMVWASSEGGHRGVAVLEAARRI